MNRLFPILFYLISITTFSQINAEKVYEVDNIKTIEIDLNTFNELKLSKSKTSNVISVLCNNCTNESLPKVVKGEAAIKISVSKQLEIPNSHQNKFRAGQPLYPFYEIKIPENFFVIINYNKGNFTTSDFVGDLKLNLSYGKIAINKFKGNVTVASFDGIINCNLKNGKISIENSKGQIENNLNNENLKTTTTSLKGIYKSDESLLTIKTVHAKVVLSAVITQ